MSDTIVKDVTTDMIEAKLSEKEDPYRTAAQVQAEQMKGSQRPVVVEYTSPPIKSKPAGSMAGAGLFSGMPVDLLEKVRNLLGMEKQKTDNQQQPMPQEQQLPMNLNGSDKDSIA